MPPKGRKRLEVKVEAGALEALSERVTASFSRNILLFACRSSSPSGVMTEFSVAISEGSHPFPSRTRKLSPPEPMVLRGKPRGRVGRCRIFFARLIRVRRVFFRQRGKVDGNLEENVPVLSGSTTPGELPQGEAPGWCLQTPSRVAKRIVCVLK